VLARSSHSTFSMRSLSLSFTSVVRQADVPAAISIQQDIWGVNPGLLRTLLAGPPTLVVSWNKSINWRLNYLLLQVEGSGSQKLHTTAQLIQNRVNGSALCKQGCTSTEDLGLRSPEEGKKQSAAWKELGPEAKPVLTEDSLCDI